jgi:PPOX class probable F420-dependent enzyme
MAFIPDSHRDLLDAQVATLATLAPDGHPQLSEVWFLADGDDVKVSLHKSRKKVRNLRHNNACTLFILDLKNPMRYLEIRGDARILPDDDYSFADKVGRKYGADLRTFDGEEQGRVEITIEPTRVNAVDIAAG